jgi:glutamine cyclotransferase
VQAAVVAPQRQAPVHGYEIVRAYPHDPKAFTQGLIYRDGVLFESTGRHGESTLRRVELATGKVLRQRRLDDRYFAEGLTDWGDRLLQLTWDTGIGFVYDRESFTPRSTFSYTGPGWGLTHDGRRLILSDGTPRLRFLDPETFREIGGVDVRDGARPLDMLNELEFIDGRVYANVWHTDRIAVIDPADGVVTAWIDFGGLRPAAARDPEAVLNGIAFDAAGKRLFVTGKWWPNLFEVRVRPSIDR